MDDIWVEIWYTNANKGFLENDYVAEEIIVMSNMEVIRELYNRCKDMNIEETVELELEAASEEERDFISLISDFVLQQKQKKVIEQKRF